MKEYFGNLVVGDELDDDGEVEFEISGKYTFLHEYDLRELKVHIENILNNELIKKIRDQIKVEEAKRGNADAVISNREIARVIHLYNKFK